MNSIQKIKILLQNVDNLASDSKKLKEVREWSAECRYCLDEFGPDITADGIIKENDHDN